MRLYVGNLSFRAKEQDVEEMFGSFGECTVKIITDKQSGQSRGFGFVEFENPAHGRAAMEGCNGKALMGRDLVVNEAREQEPRGGGGGRGHGRRREG